MTYSTLYLIPAFASEDQEIYGIWSSSERTKGGLGSQWVFTKDGYVIFTFGALVDFKYVINNNIISMTLYGPSADPCANTTKQEFSISGDTLVIKGYGNNKDQIMKRAGKPYEGKHPIVGDWTYTHYTGGNAVMRYQDSGIVQLSVPFNVETGIYKVADGEIEIIIRNKEPYKSPLEIANNKLTFTDKNNGKKRQFIRLGN